MPQLIYFMLFFFKITYGYHSFFYGKYGYVCYKVLRSMTIGSYVKRRIKSKVKGHSNLLSHELISPLGIFITFGTKLDSRMK